MSTLGLQMQPQKNRKFHPCEHPTVPSMSDYRSLIVIVCPSARGSCWRTAYSGHPVPSHCCLAWAPSGCLTYPPLQRQTPDSALMERFTLAHPTTQDITYRTAHRATSSLHIYCTLQSMFDVKMRRCCVYCLLLNLALVWRLVRHCLTMRMSGIA